MHTSLELAAYRCKWLLQNESKFAKKALQTGSTGVRQQAPPAAATLEQSQRTRPVEPAFLYDLVGLNIAIVLLAQSQNHQIRFAHIFTSKHLRHDVGVPAYFRWLW